MIVTTTPTIQTHNIIGYIGIVTGEVVIGTDIMNDLLSEIRDLVGSRSTEYESELEKARQFAIKEMIENARSLNADAIVGIDIDYESINGQSGMLMVTVSGTAVKIDKK